MYIKYNILDDDSVSINIAKFSGISYDSDYSAAVLTFEKDFEDVF